MTKKFLNLPGISKLLNLLNDTFASAADVAEAEAITDKYLENIDYDQLKFDTSEIVGDEIVIYEGSKIIEYGEFTTGSLTWSNTHYIFINGITEAPNTDTIFTVLDGIKLTLTGSNGIWVAPADDNPDVLVTLHTDLDNSRLVLWGSLGETGNTLSIRIYYNK